MKRREFITLIGGATVAPIAASAQQTGRTRHIGVLVGGTPTDPPIAMGLKAFKRALEELGWVDGRNIRVDYYFAAADVDRMHTLAKALAAEKLDLIIGHTTSVVAALQRETRNIPIVFVIVSDPVGSGFVDSLPRPGGNITGFINLEASLSGKWIEILKEIMPQVTRVALMFDPETAPYFAFYQKPFEIAASASGIEPITAPVHSADDIENAFHNFGDRAGTGLVLMPDIFVVTKGALFRLWLHNTNCQQYIHIDLWSPPVGWFPTVSTAMIFGGVFRHM